MQGLIIALPFLASLLDLSHGPVALLVHDADPLFVCELNIVSMAIIEALRTSRIMVVSTTILSMLTCDYAIGPHGFVCGFPSTIGSLPARPFTRDTVCITPSASETTP